MEQHLAKLADAIVAMRGDGAPRPAAKPLTRTARPNRTPLIAAAVAVLVAATGITAWLW